MLALTRRVRRSRAGNAAAPPLAARRRRRRSPAADRAHGALSHVAVRAGSALPRWLPCRAAPPPAGLAAVPRCPFPLAAVPLTRPLQGPLLRANAGDEGDTRGGLRVRAAAAVPDAREGYACRPPPPSQTRARAPRAGPGARRAGHRGRAPRGGRAGRRRVGGGGDEARGWGTRLRVFWSFHMMFSHLSASKRVV